MDANNYPGLLFDPALIQEIPNEFENIDSARWRKPPAKKDGGGIDQDASNEDAIDQDAPIDEMGEPFEHEDDIDQDDADQDDADKEEEVIVENNKRKRTEEDKKKKKKKKISMYESEAEDVDDTGTEEGGTEEDQGNEYDDEEFRDEDATPSAVNTTTSPDMEWKEWTTLEDGTIMYRSSRQGGNQYYISDGKGMITNVLVSMTAASNATDPGIFRFLNFYVETDGITKAARRSYAAKVVKGVYQKIQGK